MEDEEAIMGIASAVGLFESGELTLLREMFRGAVSANDNDSAFWLVAAEAESIRGVFYCEPERMTNGTWNIQFIAVDPSHQKHGYDKKLIDATEKTLKTRSGRIAIVETAGIEEFDHVRAFYISNGYQQVSSIQHFYDEGVDKVTFSKPVGEKNEAGQCV